MLACSRLTKVTKLEVGLDHINGVACLFLARWRFFNGFAKTIIITILLCSPLYLKVSLLFFQVGPIWIEADQVPALLEAIAVHPNIRYLCLSLCLCLCVCALARGSSNQMQNASFIITSPVIVSFREVSFEDTELNLVDANLFGAVFKKLHTLQLSAVCLNDFQW